MPKTWCQTQNVLCSDRCETKRGCCGSVEQLGSLFSHESKAFIAHHWFTMFRLANEAHAAQPRRAHIERSSLTQVTRLRKDVTFSVLNGFLQQQKSRLFWADGRLVNISEFFRTNNAHVSAILTGYLLNKTMVRTGVLGILVLEKWEWRVKKNTQAGRWKLPPSFPT